MTANMVVVVYILWIAVYSALLLVGGFGRSTFALGLATLMIGIWIIGRSWIQIHDEDLGFELAKTDRQIRKFTGGGAPFAWFDSELTKESFLAGSSRRRFMSKFVGYPAGLISLACAAWLLARGMGEGF